MPRFIIVDNESDEVIRLSDYLTQAYPGNANIVTGPDPDKTFTDWDRVQKCIQNIPDDDIETGVFLDLGLHEEDYQDVLRGIAKAEVIRLMKPRWLLFAYTAYTSRLQQAPDSLAFFDGVIDKAAVDRAQREGRIAYIHEQYEAAARHRGLRQERPEAAIRIVDSIGMRAAQAAFGAKTLLEVVRKETEGWQSITAEALTSGHSGAFLIAVTGQSGYGPGSLVLKLARDESVIRSEVKAISRYLAHLGLLSTRIVLFDETQLTIPGNGGVYYKQVKVVGAPILDTLKTTTWPGSKQWVQLVVNLCMGVTRSVPPERCARVIARNMLRFEQLDLDRLDTSLRFIGEFGDTLQNSDLWPLREPATTVIEEVRKLALEWHNCALTAVPLLAVVQHGDLNPGNVLLTATQELALIDLARLGQWPMGYDLGRFAAMLRLRMVDTEHHLDYMPGAFGRWLQHPTANLDHRLQIEADCCPCSAFCDRTFAGFIAENTAPTADLIAYGYALGVLWDLVKVISYMDISVFKKTWALLECYRLSRDLTSKAEPLLAVCTTGQA